LWDPLAKSASFHGVTTVVLANCGFALAPCRDQDKDLVFRTIERAEDMARSTLSAGVEWQWETYGEYMDALGRTPKSVNVASYVGHSAVRSYVMGEAAFEREGTEDEIVAMAEIVDEAMRHGAVGLSTSRSTSHATYDDAPVPSRVGT
jgi:N-acyl-D-amino-acid deacylase